MTKRRRKQKLVNNKNTMIEFVTDKSSLNSLRKMYQQTSPEAHEISRSKIEKCFFCEEVIDETNSNECHLIPDSFLSHISENEKVSTIDSMASLQTRNPENFFNSEIYKKSALTFFGVCRNCDGPEFSEYENNPLSGLTQAKMREIAMKTLLAFRYASLHKHWQAGLTIELVKAIAYKDLTPKHSASEIDDYLSNQEGVVRHLAIRDESAVSVIVALSEARKVRDYQVSFVKVLDIIINDEPKVAVQGLYIHGESIMYVNVFPIQSGSRIILFKNEDNAPIKDDRDMLNLSVMDVIAYSMVFFRKSLAISPATSSKVVDGSSTFELLGPRSLKFKKPEDLKIISMKDLQSELNLKDKVLFKRLHEFL